MKRLNKKEMEFVLELTNLLNKHGVLLRGGDDYDGDENYVGSTFSLISKSDPPIINIDIDDLARLMPQEG